MSEDGQKNDSQSSSAPQPRLFTDVSQASQFDAPLGENPQKNTDISSRIALSSNVPIYSEGWGNVQERTSRRIISMRRIKRGLRKFWYQRGAWQAVAILFLAVLTVLIVNWLSRPTQRPPLPGTPVRR